MKGAKESVTGVVAIDGKQARRTKGAKKPPLHVVSAFSAECGLVLGQLGCEEKSNEITTIPKLLEVPLAILDSYYGVYVTCPDDAQYRLDWIKDIYTPDCKAKYCLPNFFMTQEDTVTNSNLGADIGKCINEFTSRSVMEGFTDADWDQFLADLEAYKINDYVALYQKYFDAYLANQ